MTARRTDCAPKARRWRDEVTNRPLSAIYVSLGCSLDVSSAAPRPERNEVPIHLTLDSGSLDPDSVFAALADRLPDLEPRASFPAVYRALSGIRGVPGRNQFYELLTALDGSHLGDDLILRIAHDPRPSRRQVVVRQRRTWPSQRRYLRQFLTLGKHPPSPISYWAAHSRVRRERGPASMYDCVECAQFRADEWAYAGWSLFEQADEHNVWSPFPEDYDPLCRRCHRERDAVFPFPPLEPRMAPGPVASPLPPEAPDWVPGKRAKGAASPH